MAKILIVDDEDRVRRSLAHLLGRGGHECLQAGNAAQAREVLARNPCELMLCDLNMPGESGLDLARDVLSRGDDVAVVMLTAVDNTDMAEAAFELGAYGYLIKPASRNTILITVSNALRRRKLESAHRNEEHRLERIVAERTRELRLSQEETIHRLGRAAEFRDNETADHNQRMSHYCELIARRLGLPAEKCEQIRVASVMHDVGKIGVSDLVLLKPGKLTDEEFEQIKTHSEIGYHILSGSSSPLLELGAVIAYTHHEKYNGTGYPRQLAGEAIPLEGRIAAVADVYDALTSNRVYRKAWSVEKTAELLVRDKGSHFDPQIVDLFLDSMQIVQSIKQRFSNYPAPVAAEFILPGESD